MGIFKKNSNLPVGNDPPAGEMIEKTTGRQRAATWELLGSRLRTSLSSIRTFDALKSSAYRFYILGMAGQWASMNMQMVTKSLLVYRITGSAAILGLMSLANALPTLLFALFGGVIADRLPKKLIIQVGQTAVALVAFGVAITLTTGYLGPANPGSWWVLMVATVLQGAIMALMMPARQAIIPEIVNKEQVTNAVALNTTGMNALRLLAPALAGFLIDAFDFAVIFYTMTGLYALSVVFTSFLPNSKSTTVHHRSALISIKEGLTYIRGKTVLVTLILVTLVIVILSMPYQMMMPIFADDILKVGATGMGVLISTVGIGAMLGSLILASLPSKRRGAILLGGTLVLAVALVGFAFSRSMPLSLVFMVFVGFGQSARMTLGTSMLQSYTDGQYLGRVMSVNMLDMGLSQLGVFMTGILADSIGAPWAIGGFAMGLVVLCVLALIFMPSLRKLD